TRMSPCSTSTVRQVPASEAALRWLKYHPAAASATSAAAATNRVLRGRRAGLGRWLMWLRCPDGVVEANARAASRLTSGGGCRLQLQRDPRALARGAVDPHAPAVAR